MPGENGFSFVDRYHESHPGVPVILVTAHQTGAVASQAAMRPFLRVVWKPLEYAEIHELLHELASDRPSTPEK
jgi:DNA-binding NtrC family response regulator